MKIYQKVKNLIVKGKGNFGFTMKMKSKKDGKIYAVKTLDKNNKKFKEKDFVRETKISIDLNHENLVRFYGYFEDIEKIVKFKEIYKNTKEYKTYKNETTGLPLEPCTVGML